MSTSHFMGHAPGPSVPSDARAPTILEPATVFSGIGIAPEVMDVRAVGFEPARVSLAELALPERTALAIGVLGELSSSGPAAADGALCRVSAGEQLNLSGHALFFLEARVVGGDALKFIATPSEVQHLGKDAHRRE